MHGIIFSGSSNIRLARKLSELLGWPFGKIELSRFSDGETYVNIADNVKGKNVFVLQSCSHPCNESLMELLIIIDALKRLKPKKITAILPFYAYRRQEKNTKNGESITACLVARLIETAGADKVITIDIHTDKILSFFNIPAKNLEATPLFEEYFKNPLPYPSPFCKGGGRKERIGLVVMAPDKGALADAKRFAKKIHAQVAWAEKKRGAKHDKIASMKFRGKVRGKNVLIIDDEINTAGTLCEAAKLLKRSGAKNIFAACTHPVFSGPAVERLKKSPISQIIVTNTICLPPKKTKPLAKKLKIISVAPIIADAIDPVRNPAVVDVR